MEDHREGRRAFVRRGAGVFLAVLAAPVALASCGGGPPDCTTEVSPDQLSARNAAHYLDNGHNPRRECSICTFFTSGGENRCGPCSLNMGNVSPVGVCDRFQERA